MNLSIEITRDEATLAIGRLVRGLGDRAPFHEAVGKALVSGVRKHLDEKFVARQKAGIDFWTRVRDSVNYEADSSGVSVLLSGAGLRLRMEGGEVRPGKGISSHTGQTTRALAVPTDAVAVVNGHRASPAEAKTLLAFIPAAKGRDTVGFLVEGEQRMIRRGKNKGKKRIAAKSGGRLMYVLRKVTRHKPNKEVLPDDKRLLEIADRAVEEYLAESLR